MNKKKGFTLIELLAVILILGIIALIAVPTVNSIIDTSRREVAKTSTLNYVKAIEDEAVLAQFRNNAYIDKDDYTYDEINVNLNGTKPTGGIFTLEDGKVVSGIFCINGYEVDYRKDKTEVHQKCTGEELKLSGSIKLSSTSGLYIYPESQTFEVIENISGGILSCETSDAAVATCSISGTTVTVKPGDKQGVAILTIKSQANSKYKEAQAAYVATTEKGLLSYTANDYTGVYDEKAHGIVVASENAIIKYGLEEGIYNLDASPTYKDAGTYTVYFEISKTGFNTINGYKTITITQAEGKVTLSSKTANYTYPTVGSFTITENLGNGALSCISNNDSIAKCTLSGITVTVTPGTLEGSATLTIKSASSKNYKQAQETHVAVIANGVLTVTASGYEGIYDGNAYGITVSSIDSIIKYGTTNGNYTLDASPTYRDVGTYTVYYQVTKPGYKTVTGSEKIVIKEIPSAPVTYHIDGSTTCTEMVKTGETVLSTKSCVPAKNGYTFIGWREDKTASGSVLTSKIMSGSAMDLYAVFVKQITLTLYNGTTTATVINGTQFYNNGNVVNPKFSQTQTSKSGWNTRGWSTSNAGDAAVTYSTLNGTTFSSNTTLYGLYYQTIYLYYDGNGATSGSTAAQSDNRYYNSSGNYKNPTFNLSVNGFGKSSRTFNSWALGSTSGTRYNAGESVTLTANTTFFAKWNATATVSVNLSRGQEQGDVTLTKTVTTSAVTSVSISGTLTSVSNSDDVQDYRCDASLYINDTYITLLYSNQNTTQQAINTSLGAQNGVVVKLLLHPHSSDEGGGSFNGTVTYTYIE